MIEILRSKLIRHGVKYVGECLHCGTIFRCDGINACHAHGNSWADCPMCDKYVVLSEENSEEGDAILVKSLEPVSK